MPDTLALEIATPERQLVREEVTEVQLPGKNGYMGVLPGHAATLGQLGTGFLSYTVNGRKRYLSIQGGFVEIQPDIVRVLANNAERAEEIDIQRAKDDLKRAEEQVRELINPSYGVDPAIALDSLAWAQARVDAASQK